MLYSAPSILLRRVSAAAHNLASKPESLEIAMQMASLGPELPPLRTHDGPRSGGTVVGIHEIRRTVAVEKPVVPLIVIATGENPDLFWKYLINQSMFLVNAPRPTASQLVPKPFRLANAGKRIALRVSYETDDANRLSPILLRPPCQVVECALIEFDASHKPNFATASSSDVPLPRSIATRRWRRIGSDFNRYAVSRSEAISFQSAIGTMTAVGSPASLHTTWISASGTPSF